LTDFVSWVANAETVYTDRLHVAILSSILGKDVTLFGNIYHKNRGVWEISLRDSVRFVEI
ncbi:polysaccharide pyruvyl transferase family protein, partial [Candidatus Bathyarchaeota archaeon]|nr:polysaccharide pyruvyl transferase family protein [Candidatus Bathyarchaeota archaeon]